jgi:predicted flap endonuclease-1-like 5' DNA nuclease
MARRSAWLKLPLFVIVLALVVSWWRETEREEERAAGLMGARPQPREPRIPAYSRAASLAPAVEPVAEPKEVSAVERAEPDNLKRIEGIGPKIESVLQAAGIASFAQLADTSPGRLEEILAGAGIRLANPTTWPEQAALAAAGDWQGLELLQGGLRGGRRVS